MAVKPIPDGYHTVTPYLVVKDVEKLFEFIKEAYGGEEIYPPYRGEDGRIMHAELRIGDSVVMMGEAGGDIPPMPSTLNMYVENCDETYRRAVDAGAVSVRKPADQFYGDRSAGVKDPGGNFWWISTHVEDVSPEEMKRREKAAGK